MVSNTSQGVRIDQIKPLLKAGRPEYVFLHVCAASLTDLNINLQKYKKLQLKIIDRTSSTALSNIHK